MRKKQAKVAWAVLAGAPRTQTEEGGAKDTRSAVVKLGRAFYHHSMAWENDIQDTALHLFDVYHAELIGIARALRKRKRLSDTLLTSDLISEAFLRLKDTPHWKNDGHFMCSVALAMRHVSVDHARRKLSLKRGSEYDRVPLNDDVDGRSLPDPEGNLDIHTLIGELAEEDPRAARIVDCRFFAGYTNKETAGILGINEKTVRREWNKARAWFALRMAPPDD
ncbi:MAG: ECF-type sigma factor [Alphaproteobacteria bacterium]